MAIDTRERRASTVAISLYSAGPPIQAGSAGLDLEDRRLAGYGYSGIAISAINTRERRAAAVAISFYPITPSVQAGSAGLDLEDRQIAGYGYPAIPAGSGAVAVTTAARTVMLLRLRR